jgi:hypothetical protein
MVRAGGFLDPLTYSVLFFASCEVPVSHEVSTH